MTSNRKVATGLLLINWSRFTNVRMRIEGSTLITGKNGTGKSTIMDAITYLLTGNTNFNIAAKDRDRSVFAYVKGDTHSDGNDRFLRGNMDVVSYIAMEFYSPVDRSYMVVFTAIELKKDDTKTSSYWYIAPNTSLSDITFCEEKDNSLTVFLKNQISIKGRHISAKEYLGMERGTKQVLQALGLRCTVQQYKSKIIKMLSFDPQKNVDKFIQDCVLEPGNMSSLADLKEQRANYDEIKQAYDDMLESKKQLERIEVCAQDYERKLSDYHVRELMLKYQNWQRILGKIKELEDKKSKEEVRRSYWEDQKTKTEEEVREKDRELRELDGNNGAADILETMKHFEDQILKLEKQEGELALSVEKIHSLQEWICAVMDRYEDSFSGIAEFQDTLRGLDRIGEIGQKVESLHLLHEEVECLIDEKRDDKVKIADRVKADKESLTELYSDKRKLESNQPVFEKGYLDTKALIIEELAKMHIETDVRFFVELINEVKDKRWRKSIETFLGGKRFNIIVDPRYIPEVLRIVNDNPSCNGKVVITDRLEETEVVIGSAAEQLDIINPSARLYANYLLNGIHLCETLEELHDHPKGALMTNGMLAKGFAVGKMNMSNTKLFIGQDTIKLQLEELLKKIQKMEDDLKQRETAKGLLELEIKELGRYSLKTEDYDFEAVNKAKENDENLRSARIALEEYRKNPNLTAILEEYGKAKEALERANSKKDEIMKLIGGAEEAINGINKSLIDSEHQAKNAQSEFESACRDNPEYRQPAIELYNQRIQKNETVITEKTVKEWRKNLEDSIKILEDSQLAYCRINGMDNQMRGPSYIAFYREEYRKLANVEIEEARQKLDKQGERLQSAFLGDFVAELSETIGYRQTEIEKINLELKKRPFGNDVYQFEMKERTDSLGKQLFFKIRKKMHAYLDNPEYFLCSIKDDEESEQEVKDFIDIVLKEEDESEYTDYRKYFTYDMKIISKQGNEEIQATLSKKQGSASNGEKQTPYFIILAASLVQLYPKDRSSARLAFIDEAFSALSRERIEQMVDYLETNDFQVIYAAPPEKINSIGSHIKTTISLHSKGRQSFAVEGLSKSFEE